MCTVTFIPARDNVFITSSRDEKNNRLTATPPAYYRHAKSTLVYPMDAQKGGTWIAMKENGDAAVLLNGAFVNHLPAPAGSKSRGLVLLDVLSDDRPSWFFSKLPLQDAEPFTLVLFEHGSLFEMRWDGHRNHCRQLPAGRPHIWSSATLYDETIARKREQWFASFLNKNSSPTQLDILHFHQTAGDGDSRNDLFMTRDGIYRTVSITSILLCENRGHMKHLDLLGKKITEKNIELTGTILAA